MNPIDASHFRQLMGRFATGVTVVTTRTQDGRPEGMTANSISSVSLDPPLVSLCVESAAEMHAALRQADGFVLNILAANQEAISRRFANKHQDRFEGLGYTINRQGYAVLDGVLAYIECARHGDFPAGDHTVFLGRVVGGATNEGRPLLYYRGGYTELGPG